MLNITLDSSSVKGQAALLKTNSTVNLSASDILKPQQ